MRTAFIIGAIAAVVCLVGIFIAGPGQFFQAYLYSYLFWLGISLGLLGLLMLHFAVSSRWGLTLRRIAEAGGGAIWVMAILFIPLIIGLPFLYPWARPQEIAADPALKYQTWYLNMPFFIVRAVIYFAVWIALAYFANRQIARLANDPAGNPLLRGRLQGLGAAGMILYAFTMFFASVDWLMSLLPSWTSTAFGMIIVLGQAQSALAFAILVLNLFPGMSLSKRWTYETTPQPYQDLGALSITLVMAYAYVAFFQMLIQWAGNIPREVIWYVDRTKGGWEWVAWFTGIFQFIVPFCMLIATPIRHSLRALRWTSIMLLVAGLVTYFWHVKPAFSPQAFSVSLIDIFMPFALGGIWVGAFLWVLQRRPPLSAADQAILKLTPADERAIPARRASSD